MHIHTLTTPDCFVYVLTKKDEINSRSTRTTNKREPPVRVCVCVWAGIGLGLGLALGLQDWGQGYVRVRVSIGVS